MAGGPSSDAAYSDERALVEAAQADPLRFGELYQRHFDRVYAYVARRVRDRGAVEDITSDVFHHALANLCQFEWRGAPFAAWLFRIAANEIADRELRSGRESGTRAGETPDNETPERIESRARLFGLVRELPDDQRRVIEMRFAEGRSIREIALLMNRSEGAVKQLQFRGVQSLRERMGGMNG